MHPQRLLTGRIEQEECDPRLDGVGFVDRDSGEIRTDYTKAIRGPVPFFPGGLVLMRKSELAGLRFCPKFRGAAQGEEIDFALRCAQRGLEVISDPEIGIRHLKASTGGCRSETWQRRFFVDEVFNRSLFYGRHGHWRRLQKFLMRLKGFCEFHTRGARGRRWGLLLRSALALASGFLTGARLRVHDAVAGR